ncbi:unnamed protein product, partial [Arabidopsis halleri]
RESGEGRQVKVGLGLCLLANAFTETVFSLCLHSTKH